MPDRNRPDPVLDAARATVLDFGVRRTTLTEVARRAGLSRMTVYRRYSDAPELMRALMSKEFGSVVVVAQAQAAGLADGRERVVTAVVRTVELLMEHPLLDRLLELEPEVMVPYLTQRVGEFQSQARHALAGWIAQAQAEGTVRPGDPERMASSIELAARGLVLATRTLSRESRRDSVAELRRMLDAYLAP